MPRSHSRRRDSSSDSSDFGAPVVQIRTEQPRSRRDISPGIVNTQQFILGVPDQRRERASSMGASGRVNIISLDRDASPSYSGRHHRGSSSRERDLQRQIDRLELEQRLVGDKDRILRDERDRIAREKDQREQWIREAETRKREDEDKRKRLIVEAQVEEAARKIRDREARDKAVEEWKLEQFRKEEDKKRKEKEKDEQFKSEFRKRMAARGYSDASIESFLKKTKDGESSRHDGSGNDGHRRQSSGTDLALVNLNGDRPTWIKVARKHLHPDTLEHFNLPWKYDEHDHTYIIIKTYVSHSLQEELFAHSARLIRERKTIEWDRPVVRETTTTTRLTPNDTLGRTGDGMFLVRRSSRSDRTRSRDGRRRSGGGWMFT